MQIIQLEHKKISNMEDKERHTCLNHLISQAHISITMYGKIYSQLKNHFNSRKFRPNTNYHTVMTCKITYHIIQ